MASNANGAEGAEGKTSREIDTAFGSAITGISMKKLFEWNQAEMGL
jgi:hypothetical protein